MQSKILCPKCASSLAVQTPLPKAVACPECGHEWATSGAKTKTVAVLDAEKVKVTPAGGTKKGKKKGKGDNKPSWVSPTLVAGVGVGGLVLLAGVAWGGWLLFKPGPKAAVVPTGGGATWQPPADHGAVWQPPVGNNPPPPPALSPAAVAELVEKVLPATAFVLVPNPDKPDSYLAGGSGVLVHRDRRLLVTSYSLAKAGERVTVFFVERRPGGQPVADPQFYADNAATRGIVGKVVASVAAADLALVALDRLPSTADVIPFAPLSAGVGAEVLTVGTADLNPVTMTGKLWQPAAGKVRRRAKESAQSADKYVVAVVMESDKPVGDGDNGGPTVNKTGQLVGVTSVIGSDAGRRGVDIDLAEVRELVKGYALQNGWTWVDPVPTPGVSKPPAVSADRFDRLAAALEKGTPEQRVAAARDVAATGEPARKLIPKLFPLLDDADRAVRTAATDALAKLGDPRPEDEWCLTNALAGTAPHARAHALRAYATRLTVPAEYVPRLVEWLGGVDAELRVLAAAALGRYGPNCRAAALEPLARAVTDGTPAVADAAAVALTKIGPYRGPDFTWLTDRAKHDNPRLRRFVSHQIGTDAETMDAALAHLEPALADKDAGVRAAAAAGLERWGPAAKPLFKADALLALLKDVDAGVRAAAAKAVGAVELQAGLPELVELVKKDTPEVRAAAADALASLDLSDPVAGGPAADLLLGCDQPTALAKVYRKLAANGGVSKERVPLVARGLKRSEPPVRAAALAALASAGSAAVPEAGAVAGLVGEADAKLSEAAIDTLVKLGPPAAEPLAKCLDRKLEPAVKGQVCRALGRYGPAAPPIAIVYLFAAAGKEPDLREAIGEAAVAINTDDISAQLRQHVTWSLVNRKRVSKYPAEVQLWAFGVIVRLDPNKLSDKERERLLDALRNQADTDPDKDCRREAKEVYAKLKAQVKAK